MAGAEIRRVDFVLDSIIYLLRSNDKFQATTAVIATEETNLSPVTAPRGQGCGTCRGALRRPTIVIVLIAEAHTVPGRARPAYLLARGSMG